MGKKRFDATLKQIFEAYLAQWLPYFARPLGVPKVERARVIDSDVSTVTAAADKVVRVGGRKP